jgi:hypothetical protein
MEGIMFENKENKLVFKITSEEVILAQSETDKLIFEISGEQYLKYIQWKWEVEERIVQKELETGQRVFDRKKLSQKQLTRMKKELENGQMKKRGQGERGKGKGNPILKSRGFKYGR